MISFRNLHSTKVSSKPPALLSVQNIIETYDFNGLKIDAPPPKQKQHPLYTNGVIKKLQTSKQLINDASTNTKENLPQNAVNGNKETNKEQVDEKLSKDPICLSMFISDQSKDINSIKNKTQLFDEPHFMSYSTFLKKSFENQRSIIVRKTKTKQLTNDTNQRTTVRKCYLCDLKFSSKLALAKHRSTCCRKSQKKCVVKTLAQKLIQKVKLKKSKLRPKEKKPRVLYPCTKCTDQFLSQSSLNAHLKFDHRPRPTCKLCNRMFDCRRKLVEHEENCAGLHDGAPSKKQTLGEIEFKSTTEIHICILCENPFPTSQELRQHKLLLNKRLPFDIELSNDKRTEVKNIQKENFEIYVKKNPVYSIIKQPNPYVGNDCRNCSKLFNNEKRLKQHEVFCHTKTLRTCPYCQKIFRGMYQRNQHICYCSKRNKPPTSVKVMSIDSNTKTYECQCKKTFDSTTTLNEHLTNKHGDTFCDECEKTYHETLVLYYGVHFCIFTQSEEFTTPFAIPANQKCLLCSEKIVLRSFTKATRHNCKSEIFRITLADPVEELCKQKKPKTIRKDNVCNDCHKKFKNRKKLLMHKNKLLQPETCVLCLKKFSFSNNYIRHMHLKHNKRCCPHCLHIYSHWNQVHDCSSITPRCCVSVLQDRVTNKVNVSADHLSKRCEKKVFDVSTTPLKTELLQSKIITPPKCSPINVESLHNDDEFPDSSDKSPSKKTEVSQAKAGTSTTKHEALCNKAKPSHNITIASHNEILNCCYICSKDFVRSKSKLFEHLATHSKLRPYKCRRCNFKTRLAVNLKTHALNKHKLRVDVSRRLEKLQRLHKIELCEKCNIYCINQPLVKKHVCSKNNTDMLSISVNNVRLPSYVDDINSTGSTVLAFIPKPTTSISPLLNKDKFFVNAFASCEHCLSQFPSCDLLELHLKYCNKKLNCVMPVGPSLEACLNFNTSQNEQTKMSDDVMSLQEAEESLLSLIGLNDSNTTESISSTEQVTSPLSPSISEVNLVEQLLLQDEIPIITIYSLDTTPTFNTDNTTQSVKRKRGRPSKASVGLQVSSCKTENIRTKLKPKTTPSETRLKQKTIPSETKLKRKTTPSETKLKRKTLPNESPKKSRRSSLSRRCKYAGAMDTPSITLTDCLKSNIVTQNDSMATDIPNNYVSTVTQINVSQITEKSKPRTETVCSTKSDNNLPITILDTFQIFPCKFCDINFDTEKSRKIHTEDIHQNVDDTPRETIKTRVSRESFDDDDFCITDVKSLTTVTNTSEITQIQTRIDKMFNAFSIPNPSPIDIAEDHQQPKTIASSDSICLKKPLCLPLEGASLAASKGEQIDTSMEVVVKDIIGTPPANRNSPPLKEHAGKRKQQTFIKKHKQIDLLVTDERKPSANVDNDVNNKTNCSERNNTDNKKRRLLLKSDSGFDLTKELFQIKTTTNTKTKNMSKESKVVENSTKPKINGLLNKPKLKSKLKDEPLKRYRKLKPREREKAILKDMVEQASERKKTHEKQPVKKKTTPTKSFKEQLKASTTGGEYSNGITNYFADIMLKSTTNRNERKKSDYVNKMKSRLQKQFEVNKNGHLSVIDRGLPLVSHEVDTTKTTEERTTERSHKLSVFEQKLQTQSKCLSNSIKNDALKKPKLLINQKSLNELRLKVRKKSVEISTEVNKTINDSKINCPTTSNPILNNSTSSFSESTIVENITEQNIPSDDIGNQSKSCNETTNQLNTSVVSNVNDISNITNVSSESDNGFDDKNPTSSIHPIVSGDIDSSDIPNNDMTVGDLNAINKNGALDSLVDYNTLAKIMSNVQSLPLVGKNMTPTTSKNKKCFDFLEDY